MNNFVFDTYYLSFTYSYFKLLLLGKRMNEKPIVISKNVCKLFLCAATFSFFSWSAEAQTIDVINLETAIASNASLFINGYAEKLSGEDITYSNLWNTKDKAFLTRATTGKKEIAWQSEPVTIAADGKAHFLLLVCVDQANPSSKFNLYLDEHYYGDLINFHTPFFQAELAAGIQVKFDRIGHNEWGDGACFMELSVPASLVSTGKPVAFKLVGENASANTWFMVFKNQDLVAEVVHKANTDACFILQTQGDRLQLLAPDIYKGITATIRLNEGKEQTGKFLHKAGKTFLDISASPEELRSLSIRSQEKELLTVSDFKQFRDTTFLEGFALIKRSKDAQGNYVQQTAYSNAADYMKQISVTPWRNAQMYIMVSSHQDIGWVDTPYRCIEKRDEVIISPALDLLEKHPDYRYDIEDVLMLEEYLERNPRKRPLIERLIANGQLGVGASYTQPYEEMQTGEALVRQFYYGKRFLTCQFDGYNPRTYWNVDVPGRTLQMPQILSKSGVDGLQYSRHERGLYNWYSPDSSHVIVHTPGHYTVASQFLRKSPEEGLEKFHEYVESLPDYRSNPQETPIIGMLSAEDMSPAHTYYHWIDKFEVFAQTTQAPMPTLQHATSDMFIQALKETHPVLPSLVGERPDLWQYIHGPSHERALTSYRESNRKAIFAETFSTIASLLKGSFDAYPKRELDQMWKDIIYADHGWGGNGGHVTDSLFHARYNHADTLATGLSREAAQYIAGKIAFNRKLGTPVVVFNPLSTVCSSPVRMVIDTKKHPVEKLSLLDVHGKPVTYQLSGVGDGQATLEFIATDMPSIGYVTYYLSAKSSQKQQKQRPAEESDYYALQFDEKGTLKQIVDKEVGEELFDTSKFEVGEIFSMQSVGNGAGEFATMQLPTMEDFEKTSQHRSSWILQESGDVYSLYRSETPFKDATVVRYLKLYKTIKRIDFPSSILRFTGRDYREFRQAFALKSKGEVRYEVPFGTVTVGKDEIAGAGGERYQDDTKDIHPRSITNWIGSDDGKVDVKLTSSVILADYIDPTDNPAKNTILQPILFASRRSCHWLGEFYSQQGDHHFEFSLRSDRSGTRNSELESVAANYKPYVVYAPESYQVNPLPDWLSFISVDKKNLSISALKKHEDDNRIVLRLYDAAHNGEATEAAIHSYFPIHRLEQTDMLEFSPSLQQSEKVTVGNRAIETFSLTVM